MRGCVCLSERSRVLRERERERGREREGEKGEYVCLGDCVCVFFSEFVCVCVIERERESV